MEEEYNLTSLWFSEGGIINHQNVQELWYVIHNLKKRETGDCGVSQNQEGTVFN